MKIYKNIVDSDGEPDIYHPNPRFSNNSDLSEELLVQRDDHMTRQFRSAQIQETDVKQFLGQFGDNGPFTTIDPRA